MGRGYVYLLCDGEKFKIGMTRNKNINKRIKELQTGNPNEIWLRSYYETENPSQIEKIMHARYAPNNVKNEWFDLSPRQVNQFINECKKCEKIIKSLSDNPFI